MKLILLLLFSFSALSFPITKDRIVPADRLTVGPNSSEITVKDNMDLDGNNLFGILGLTVTGTTTLNTGLSGVAKITAGVVSTSDVNLTSEVTGFLPVANGGTNSSSALGGSFIMVSNGSAIVESATTSTDLSNFLISPLTTNGDLLIYNAGEQRLPPGAVTEVLTMVGGFPAWAASAGGGGSPDTVVTKTSSTTLLITESIIICDTTSGELILTLPTAVGNADLKYQITMKVETNKCIVDGDGTETIGGALTRELYETNNSITIVSDNVAWFILERTSTISVQGAGNGGTVLSPADTVNIDFTETRDQSQSFTGTEFTSPEGGTYCARGVVQFTSNITTVLKAYINGSFVHRAGEVIVSESRGIFQSCLFMNQGSVWSLRSSSTATLSAVSTSHWISISKVD